jgi:hypothetical protein
MTDLAELFLIPLWFLEIGLVIMILKWLMGKIHD